MKELGKIMPLVGFMCKEEDFDSIPVYVGAVVVLSIIFIPITLPLYLIGKIKF